MTVWNANGLAHHVQEVKIFLAEHDIDVMLISEAHMTAKSYVRIPNYSVYYTTHPEGKARGGAAFIIKSRIKHHELAKYSEKHIQAASVAVDTGRGSITLSAVYCPPGPIIPCTQFSDFFHSLGHRFLVGGDYNAKHHKWGSRMITPRGRQLLQAMTDNKL